MKIKIRFMDNSPEKVFDVAFMGMKDGFMTFNTAGEPLENGEPTLDFVYSVQAHLVRDIEKIDEEAVE